MKIKELDEVVETEKEKRSVAGELSGCDRRLIVHADAKKTLVGVGARLLFYPTLLYNVFRYKINQAEFRWWDQIDQFLFLGAVPFPKDVRDLKMLGVGGVITLNESFETLVPASLYHARGIDHLVIPTRDYFFAPSFADINRAVDFIHRHASSGQRTYVHCKAGRGRSATIVLCYLVEYKNMTPTAALEYVQSIRPRVQLAASQWKAVQEFKEHRMASVLSPPGDIVLITKADLEGYESPPDDSSKELAVVPKMTRIKPGITRLFCLFATSKVSGGWRPVTRQLTEARAF